MTHVNYWALDSAFNFNALRFCKHSNQYKILHVLTNQNYVLLLANLVKQ